MKPQAGDSLDIKVTRDELVLICHAVHRVSMDLIRDSMADSLTDLERANRLTEGKCLEGIYTKLRKIKNPYD